MTNIEKIKNLIEQNHGIITTKILAEHNIHRQYLKILLDEGYIIQEARGVYATQVSNLDEYYLTSYVYKNAIYSHGTALYLHGLVRKRPFMVDMTFPNNVRPDKYFIEPHYINKERFNIGKTTKIVYSGIEINIYNLERTICDIIRDRNKIDSQIINEAIKMYLKREDKNLNLLYEYAKIFKISKIIKMYFEILM